MKLLRGMIVGVGVIILFWFILPVFFTVSLNIGNLTGILVSLGIVFCGVFLPWIQKKVMQWNVHPKKKWLVRTGTAFFSLILILVLTETACMVKAACEQPAEGATAVVLGCRVYGERPSLSMVERLEAAHRYLLEDETAVCVLSGGQGSGEEISEAECMYRWLIEKGIEPERLFKEENSSSTRENLLFSRELIESEGLNPQIAITTSEYHQYRAGKIAKELGLEYGANPGRTAIWLLPTFYVRELYGIMYEWFL